MYIEILHEEIQKEADTETGMLRAYYATLAHILETGNVKEAQKFVTYTKKQWGEPTATWMQGDVIDYLDRKKELA